MRTVRLALFIGFCVPTLFCAATAWGQVPAVVDLSTAAMGPNVRISVFASAPAGIKNITIMFDTSTLTDSWIASSVTYSQPYALQKSYVYVVIASATIPNTYYVRGKATDGDSTTRNSSLLSFTIQPPPDTLNPVVSISSPSAGAVLSGVVNVLVDAADNVGVSSVAFYVDGVFHSSDTSSPYSFNWDTGGLSGSHTLSARAYDAAGHTGVSSGVSVTITGGGEEDTTPPTVAITSPVAGTVVSGLLEVGCAAADDVGISSVAFFIDGVFLSSDTSNPYSFAWYSGDFPGSHILSAKAYDAAGNEGVAAAVSVSAAGAAENGMDVPELLYAFGAGNTVTSLPTAELQGVFDVAGQLGVKYFKMCMRWSEIEPSQGNYDWAKYDEIARMAAEKGLSVIPFFNQEGVPCWARKTAEVNFNGQCLGEPIPSSGWLVAGFIKVFLARYKNQMAVRYLELENEANASLHWPDTPQYLAEVDAQIYNAVKSVYPDIRVLSASIHQPLDLGGNSSSMTVENVYTHDFLAAYAGALPAIDGFTIHDYPYMGHTETSGTYEFSTQYDLEENVRAVLDANGKSGVPIVVTETPYGRSKFGEELGAAHLVQGALLTHAKGNALGRISQSIIDGMGGTKTGVVSSTATNRVYYKGFNAFKTLRETLLRFPLHMAHMQGTVNDDGVWVEKFGDGGGGELYVAFVPIRFTGSVGTTVFPASQQVTIPVGAVAVATATSMMGEVSAAPVDSSGNVTLTVGAAPVYLEVSGSVSGLDVTIPTVSIASPSAGAVLSGVVNVLVNAADNVGVSSVAFYVDGVFHSSDMSSPYSFNWNTGGLSGSHTLSARAYDAAGNEGVSVVVAITVSSSGEVTPVNSSASAFGVYSAFRSDGHFLQVTGMSNSQFDTWVSTHMANLGAGWTRFSLLAPWEFIEPSLGYGYNWSTATPNGQPDAVLATVSAAGVNVLLNIQSLSFGGGTPTRSPLTNPAEYQNFITALAERYDGDGVDDAPGNPKVDYFQLANELQDWYGRGLSAADYAQAASLTLNALRAANPDAKLVLVAQPGALHGLDIQLRDAIDACKAAGVDFAGVDIHWWDWAPDGVSWKTDAIPEARQYLDSLGLDHVEIWSGENATWAGCPAGNGPPLPVQTEAEQAVALVKRFVWGGDNGLDRLLWSQFVDNYRFMGSSTAFFNSLGLIDDGADNCSDPARTNTTRISYWSYKKLAETIDTDVASVAGTVSGVHDGTGVYAYQYTRLSDSSTFYILWREGAAGNVTINVPGSQYHITNLIPDRYGNFQESEASPVSGSLTIVGVSSSPLLIALSAPAGDSTPPIVSITSPSVGAVLSGVVNVLVNAADNVGVSSVAFYVDGVFHSSDTSSPYSFNWNTAGLSGSHTLSARAYDAAGNAGTSAGVSITVNAASVAAEVSIDYSNDLGAFDPYLFGVLGGRNSDVGQLKSGGFRLVEAAMNMSTPQNPDDPSQYDFSMFDAEVSALVEVGIEPLVWFFPYSKPADLDAYGRFAANVARHLNQGWANGHVWDVKAFRFGNEPEGFWEGTKEEFFQTYAAWARALKSVDAGFVLDAPGFVAPVLPGGALSSWLTDFLEYLNTNAVPVDYVSMHGYSPLAYYTYFSQPGKVMDELRKYPTLSTLYGTPRLGFDEWNLLMSDTFTGSYSTQLDGAWAAAQNVNALVNLVEAGAGLSIRYGGTTNGASAPCHDGALNGCDGSPKPVYYALAGFNQLGGSSRLATTGTDHANFAALAGKTSGQVTIVLANFDVSSYMDLYESTYSIAANQYKKYSLDFGAPVLYDSYNLLVQGLPWTASQQVTLRRYIVDDANDLALAEETTLAGAATLSLSAAITAPSVQVITLTAPAGAGEVSTTTVVVPGVDRFIFLESAGTLIRLGIPRQTFIESVAVSARVPVSFPRSASPQDTMLPTGIGVEITLDKNLHLYKEVSIDITYPDEAVTGMDESRLVLASYDETSKAWVPLESQVNPHLNRITGKTPHFSLFQIMQQDPGAGLTGARIYPNPFYPGRGQDKVVFAGLPDGAKIKIFTLQGELVWESEANASGMAFWYGKNKAGLKAASGVYIAYFKHQKAKKMLKLSVIR